jgi:Mg/Co/Ni transporter MgtE
MAQFHIPENCSAYVPMILKEFCSSKINGLVMKTFSGSLILFVTQIDFLPMTTVCGTGRDIKNKL